MEKTIDRIASILIIVWLSLIVIFVLITQVYSQDTDLKNLEQRKQQAINEYERAYKKLEALERMDAAEKAFREVLQLEQAAKEKAIKETK